MRNSSKFLHKYINRDVQADCSSYLCDKYYHYSTTIISSLQGSTVQVQVKNGCIYEGVFNTYSEKVCNCTYSEKKVYK